MRTLILKQCYTPCPTEQAIPKSSTHPLPIPIQETFEMAPKDKNPFSKFRMASARLTNIETEKLITHVPVGKPNKQKFVRVHPDQAFWFECAILKLEDEQRPFLVTPEIASLIVQDIKLVVLRLTIDRQAIFLFGPYRLCRRKARRTLGTIASALPLPWLNKLGSV